jgi:hypothetical protein
MMALLRPKHVVIRSILNTEISVAFETVVTRMYKKAAILVQQDAKIPILFMFSQNKKPTKGISISYRKTPPYSMTYLILLYSTLNTS